MLDIKFIRDNLNLVKDVCRKKSVTVDLDRLLEVDKERREAIIAFEEMQKTKNQANKEIQAAETEKEKKIIILKMKELDLGSDRLNKKIAPLEKEYLELMYQVPNIPLADVPEGKDDRDNKVIKRWGEPTKFDFPPKDYIELGAELDLIDTEKASKITGTRFGYLKNDAALMEFALIHYAISILTSPETIKNIALAVDKNLSVKPFVPVIPPVMIRPDVFTKMARLNKEDQEERYYFPKDDQFLIGSAEHTLGPLHMEEILDEKTLPRRYLGFSTCFRREAGSYGKDTRGIFRVHQFDKVEMESFTSPEDSLKEQNFLVAIQEYLMQALKIPYQVVMTCTGDMGAPDARHLDIESWMPGQNRYRETHSADLMTDYQARRLNTRLRRENGKVEYLHMNDATAIAIGRTIIAILENYQQKDGSVMIPEVLQKYMGKQTIK